MLGGVRPDDQRLSMLDGSVDGPTTERPITWYFDEPLPTGDTTLSCGD